MSKLIKIVGVIAGAVALVATGVGAFAAAGSQLASVASSVASIASLVSGVAGVISALTYKPPPARGSVAQVIIAPDAPAPYVMGEVLTGGVLRHDVAYGPTLNKVPNPYRFMALVLSVAGPVQAITPRVDQAAIGSYYTGFLYTDTQLGTTPDVALTPQWSGAPGWTTDSKLSGKGCIGWSLKFDKDGKKFASGVPPLAALVQGVKVYDPRLDSTFPGGSGACRLNDETTFVYSANPALHAATYAYGRFQNSGKRVFGVGLPADAIDWANVAAWANVCDANSWTIAGVIYEPADRWANLKDIALAGGAVPLVSGGVLAFHYAAPRVALDTATDADLAEDDIKVTAMASWRDRINAVVPKYRSADHNWELVDAEKVTVSSYVTEDGEEKAEVFAYNHVKNKDQAAQLAAYRLVDGRELQPIEISYGPRLFAYGPGDCLTLDHPEAGLTGPFVILTRKFDPSRMVVTFTLISETAAKHAYALGRTGVAPPTPALGQSGEDRDELASAANSPLGYASTQIRSAAIKNPRDTSDVAIPLLTSTYDSGSGTSSVLIARHDWDYPGLDADTTREAYLWTGLSPDLPGFYYFDDETLTAGTVTYGRTNDPAAAQNSTAHPYRHALGWITTANATTGLVEGGQGVGYGLDLSYYS